MIRTRDRLLVFCLLMILGISNYAVADETIYCDDGAGTNFYSGDDLTACEICRDHTSPTFNVFVVNQPTSGPNTYECGKREDLRKHIFNVLNTPAAGGAYTDDHSFTEELELIPNSDACTTCTKLAEGDGPDLTTYYAVNMEDERVATASLMTQYYALYASDDEPDHAGEVYQKIYWETIKGDVTTYEYELRRRHLPEDEFDFSTNEVVEIESIHVNRETGSRTMMPRQYFEADSLLTQLAEEPTANIIATSDAIISKKVPTGSSAVVSQAFSYDTISLTATSASGQLLYAQRPSSVLWYGYFPTDAGNKSTKILCRLMRSLSDEPYVLSVNDDGTFVPVTAVVDGSTNEISIPQLQTVIEAKTALSELLASETSATSVSSIVRCLPQD